MKQVSLFRKLVAAESGCTLCYTGMTAPAFSPDDVEELPARFD